MHNRWRIDARIDGDLCEEGLVSLNFHLSDAALSSLDIGPSDRTHFVLLK